MTLFSSSCGGFLKILCLIALLFSVGCVKQNRFAPHDLPDAEVVVLDTKNAKKGKPQTDVVKVARTAIGTPYRFGGTNPSAGFDCSGLILWSYQQIGVSIPRRAQDQFRFGTKVAKQDLQPGDLVFFRGTNRRTGWHSGIYTGDGMFLHSPRTGKTVTEVSLNSDYFSRHYVGARRVPRDGREKAMYANYQEEMRQNANAVVAAKKAAAEQKRLTASKKSNKKGATLVADANGKKKKGAVDTKKKPAATEKKKNTTTAKKKDTPSSKKSASAKKQGTSKATAKNGKADNKTKTAAVDKKANSKAKSGRNS